MDNLELNFLFESNLIENERSIGALSDAVRAWIFAKDHKHSIDVNTIQTINYQLLRRLDPKIAGKIRNCDLDIVERKGNKSTLVERCPPPSIIYSELEKWSKRFYKARGWEEIKKESIRFLKIHPLYDGNGRTGRILMNIQRINDGMDPLVIFNQDKAEYYNWFA